MIRTSLLLTLSALIAFSFTNTAQAGGKRHKKAGNEDQSQTKPSADNPLPVGSIWTGEEASLLRDSNAPQKVTIKVEKSDASSVTLRLTRADGSIWTFSIARDGSKLTVNDIAIIKHKHRGAGSMRETSGSGYADGKSLKLEFESHFFSDHTKNQPVHSALQATPGK